jgi:hypothetical protein
LSIERLEDRTVPSTFTVLNLADSGAGSLRTAIADANTNPGADLIRFASTARDGTITLTSGELAITDDLNIDGPGAGRLAVSGNDASRVFNIGSGVAVAIDELTVTHGRGLLRGGGILNDGTLTLSHAVVSDNVVVGVPGVGPTVDAFGGGILNRGTLTVRNSTFVHNRSLGADGNPGGPGSVGLGGAIMSTGTATTQATATVSGSTFLDNQAIGGAAGPGSPSTRGALGGAIMNDSSTFTISTSVFRNNQAIGGFGGAFPNSAAIGGAIANVALTGDAVLFVSHSVLIGNRAVGGAATTGNGPHTAKGGAIANFIAPFAPLPVTVSATAHIDHSTFLGNQAIGGAATVGNGGTGQGGAITNENGGILTVTSSLLALNRAVGGAGGVGGTGGSGLGGGIFNGGPHPVGTPSLTLQSSLIALNRADGGAAGDGVSAGLGQGGGLYLTPGGGAYADLVFILANDASTSDDNVFGTLG